MRLTETEYFVLNNPVGAASEIERLRSDNERLQKAHDHQHEMAGLMLREAERYGRKLAEVEALLWEARLRGHFSGSVHGVPDLPARIDAFLATEGER